MSDIFQSQDRIYGDIPINRADRNPCIVCGHPTGDCSPADHNPQDIHIAFSNTNHETLTDLQTVYVDEDIYETRAITPYTNSTVLVVKKGQTISLKRALELGIKIN